MWGQIAGAVISKVGKGGKSAPTANNSRTGAVNVGGFNTGTYESETVKLVKYGAMALVAMVVLKKVLK